MCWVLSCQLGCKIHAMTNLRFRYFPRMHITMRPQEMWDMICNHKSNQKYWTKAVCVVKIKVLVVLCTDKRSFSLPLPCWSWRRLHNKKWPFEASSANLPVLDKNIHFLYHHAGLKGKHNSDIKRPSKWFQGSFCFCLTCQNLWQNIKELCIPHPRCLSRERMF